MVGLTQTASEENVRVLLPAASEEVAYRAFDRGLLLVVPIDAKDYGAPWHFGVDRQPDLLYSARPLDVRQLGRGPGVHPEGGRDLPSRPKIASCLGAQPLGRPGAASLFTARVLRTDRTRPSVRQPPKVAEVHPEPVEVGNRPVCHILAPFLR